MFEGYPLRKFTWEDWVLIILTSSISLQFICSLLGAYFVGQTTIGVSEAEFAIIVEDVTSKATMYGTILSLPLTLLVIYVRKIPIFNRRGLSKEDSFIIRGLTKDDWSFLGRYIPISYLLYTAGSVLLANLLGEVNEAANQLAVESLFDYIPFWQMFLMIVIAAPITEEILFRGLVLFSHGRLDTTWTRVIISAIVFGGVHLVAGFDIFSAYTYIGMGVIMTLPAKKTQSIEASMVYHFLNNLVGFLMIIFVG